jgi:hypothetical protein
MISAKIGSLFLKLDTAIFELIDKFKTSQTYMKFSEQISALDEDVRKLINYIIMFLVIALPLIFLGIFKYSNWQLSDRVEKKQDILSKALMIQQTSNTLSSLSGSGKTISPTAFSSQNMVNERIRTLLSTKSVDLKKIQITDYTEEKVGTSITKVQLALVINQMSLNDLKNTIDVLTTNESFIIKETRLTIGETEKDISGQLTILHLGKNN